MSCEQCGDDEAVSKINNATDIAFRHGQNDGAHHKAWVIDQIIRALLKEDYATWITNYKLDEGDPEAYEWDEGIAP